MKKTNLDNYEFTVTRQDFIPDTQNPDFIDIDVEFEFEGETYEVKGLRFEPRAISDGSYEQQVCIAIDKKIDEVRGETKHEIPDLEGETVENTGYDGTGTQNDYPEKPDV